MAIQESVANPEFIATQNFIVNKRIEDMKNVIYVFVSTFLKGPAKVYVGQTKNSIITRWQQHIKNAAEFETEEHHYPRPAQSRYSLPYQLYKDMQKLAWNNFIIYPLEIIAEHLWQAESAIREQNWCNVFIQHGYMLYNNKAPHAATNIAGQPRIFHSHDWHRRSQVLCQHLHAGSHIPHIAQLSIQSLIGIRGFLSAHSVPELGPPFLEGDPLKLVQLLDDAITAKQVTNQFIAHPAEEILIIPKMVNMFMDKANLQSIFDGCMSYLPPNFPFHIKVLFKYSSTLGNLLCNYKDIALSSTPQAITDILNAPCSCSQLPAEFGNPDFQGCVFTPDWKVVCHPNLEQLCSFGTKHRPLHNRHPLNAQVATPLIMAVMHASLDRFTTQWGPKFGKDALAPWQEAIERTIEQEVQAIPASFSFTQLVNAQPGTAIIPWSPSYKHIISQLQDRFYITYQDKSSQNFVFICKKLAVRLIREDLSANAVYEPVPLIDHSHDATVVHLMHEFERQLRGLGFTGHVPFPVGLRREHGQQFGTPAIAHYAGIGKMHKKPAQLRYLACSVQVFTSPLAMMLTNALWAANQLLDTVWHNTWLPLHLPPNLAAHTEKSWILQRSEDLTRIIHQFNDACMSRADYTRMQGMATYDFERLYTNLPLDTIVTAVTYVLEKVFSVAKETIEEGEYVVLKVFFAVHRRAQHEWTKQSWDFDVKRVLRNDSPGKSILLTHGLFADLVELLVRNTFITFGGSIYQQLTGIPMGTNPAVFIANFALYYFELKFVENVVDRTNKAFATNEGLTAFNYAGDKPFDPAYITSISDIIMNYDWGYITKKAEEYIQVAFEAGLPPADYSPAQYPDYPPLTPMTPGYNDDIVILERFFMVHIILSFQSMGRFVDDMFTIANTVFPQLMYTNQHFGPLAGIYPPELQLNAARSGLGIDTGISMLDLSIHLSSHYTNAKLVTKLFDKRQAPEFQAYPIIRFPHITSLLSRHCVYNVIKGRFHSWKDIITDKSSFTESLASLLFDLSRKGYLFPRMHNKLTLCLRNNPGLFNTSPSHLLLLIYRHLHTLGTQTSNDIVKTWSTRYITSIEDRLNYRR